ncbi:zinc/manganese/iron ABC transporter, periplasmiczinc/manganese/iron-binding protein [Pseudooceanicola batsensis HTCC2597]|uniref:Zinc/manganese/iron ABC transporter, periplasmiczinc/manganese/iron-binding protein n=2 Tax=Pseudooceanicola batsensis TaxID=314255 RepID=A3TYE2_PSEBH|nr:zinc/manganese/iron ABC transporter, periplasmiczinc/manganese/iron-binding protein [Pseudooceanicola batsensis HTCC2597]
MILTRRSFMHAGLAAVAMPAPALRAADTLDVVATTGMIADAARYILGDAGSVRALMGPGVDPHSFRQTRSDIVAMTRADLILWHGLYLEAQMEEFLLNLARSRKVVAVAEALDRERLLGHADYDGRFDPHVWMAPAIWTEVVAAIADALQSARPDLAPTFEARTQDYRATVARLHDYAQSVLATVPESARVLVTAHDAFSYFGRAYGLEVLGIQGISTESEAGLNRIRQLVDILVERGIGAVFVETSVSDRNMRALIEGAAASSHEVRIGGELYSDAMGEPGTYEGTYPGMIDHNVTTITRALGGDAPERGMDGNLAAAG